MNSDVLEKERIDVWNTLLHVDRALVEKDAAAFEQLLSADFIGAVPTGAFFNKDSYIKHHCNNNFGVVKLVEGGMDAASIRIFKDTAVVNRRVHAHFKLPGGHITEYDVQRIEVLAKINNQWIMLSGQGTQVQAPVNQQD